MNLIWLILIITHGGFFLVLQFVFFKYFVGYEKSKEVSGKRAIHRFRKISSHVEVIETQILFEVLELKVKKRRGELNYQEFSKTFRMNI